MYDNFFIWKLKAEGKIMVSVHFNMFNTNLQVGKNNTIPRGSLRQQTVGVIKGKDGRRIRKT